MFNQIVIIMKKVGLILAGMLFMGVAAVQAQEQDTTIAPKKDTTMQEQQGEKQGTYQLRDMTIVQSADIPAGLRETLQGAEYKGWDDPTTRIYRNQTSDLYVVQIMDGTRTKSFRFDRDGKPIKE